MLSSGEIAELSLDIASDKMLRDILSGEIKLNYLELFEDSLSRRENELNEWSLMLTSVFDQLY